MPNETSIITDFHLVEYQALRDEMVLKIEQMGDLYRNYLISLFATIAWILTYSNALDKLALAIGACVPFLVTHYYAEYRKDHSRAIHTLGSYLTSIEHRYASEGYGWQRSVRTNGGKTIKLYTRTANLFLYARIGTAIFSAYIILARIFIPPIQIFPFIQGLMPSR